MTKITIIGDKFRQGTITFRNILTNRYGTKKFHRQQTLNSSQPLSILPQFTSNRQPPFLKSHIQRAKICKTIRYYFKSSILDTPSQRKQKPSHRAFHHTSLNLNHFFFITISAQFCIIRHFTHNKPHQKDNNTHFYSFQTGLAAVFRPMIYHNPKSASSSHINFHRQAMIFPQHPSNSTKNPNSAALSPISRLSKKKKRSLTTLGFDILDTFAMIRFGQIYLLTL